MLQIKLQITEYAEGISVSGNYIMESEWKIATIGYMPSELDILELDTKKTGGFIPYL